MVSTVASTGQTLQTVFDPMATLGLTFVGPQCKRTPRNHGPAYFLSESKNVPAYHSTRQTATATRQLEVRLKRHG